MLVYYFCLILVAFLWGGTNPLIKAGSQNIVKIHCESQIEQYFREIIFLLTTWQVSKKNVTFN